MQSVLHCRGSAKHPFKRQLHTTHVGAGDWEPHGSWMNETLFNHWQFISYLQKDKNENYSTITINYTVLKSCSPWMPCLKELCWFRVWTTWGFRVRSLIREEIPEGGATKTKTIFEIICAWQSNIQFVLGVPQVIACISFRKFRC